MKSVYAASFTAALESAKILLRMLVLTYPKLEMHLLRLHPIWANSLASAVCSRMSSDFFICSDANDQR